MFLAKDKELLARFKLGERPALDQVYRYYAPGVTSFLRKGFTFRSGKGHFYFKGMQDQSELRSCVQEVFRRAFEKKALHSYNGINSFTNWVLAISRNMVINRFRNREIAVSNYISPSDDRSHLSFLDDEVTEEFSGVLYGMPTRQQDRQYENAELKELMEKFVHDLSEHDRLLLVHRFSDGKGQEETAQLLNSTRMKVRTAESKLRNRLRAFLRNSGYIDDIRKSKKS